eukprot:3040631-Amphidinium_carterae.1
MLYNKEEQTQSRIALSSAEAELYARGQATLESQHAKQVIEEMAIPKMDTQNATMMINTDSNSGKALASKLGINKKSSTYKMSSGELTIKNIPTTHKLLAKLGLNKKSKRAIEVPLHTKCHPERGADHQKVPTTHNPADALTKYLPAIRQACGGQAPLCAPLGYGSSARVVHCQPTGAQCGVGVLLIGAVVLYWLKTSAGTLAQWKKDRAEVKLQGETVSVLPGQLIFLAKSDGRFKASR